MDKCYVCKDEYDNNYKKRFRTICFICNAGACRECDDMSYYCWNLDRSYKYCYTCGFSVCNDCLNESDDAHKKYEGMEKNVDRSKCRLEREEEMDN